MARWEREFVGNVPADALDTQARERVGDLLRSARQERPLKPAAGTVVEFLHGGKLKCGFLRFTPMTRKGLLIVDLDGQERRLRADRVLHHGTEQVAVQPVERGLEQLRPIDDLRRTVASRIDLLTLRELAIETAGEGHPWSARQLARIHDSTDRVTAIQHASMLRALFAGQEFRRIGDQWVARSSQALQGAQAARRREGDRQRLVVQQAAWLQRLAAGELEAPAPAGADDLLRDLASYVLSSPEDEPGQVLAIVHGAHLHGRAAVKDLLVRIGFWDPDENLVLLREQIPQEFSAATRRQVKTLAMWRPLWRGWPGWGHTHIGIADGRDPAICLRAWAISRRRHGWRLRLHVALPGLWLREGGAILEQIIDRGVRVDLPDRSVPLIPSELLHACSFNSTQARPALTMVIDLDETGRLQKVRLRRSRVRLHCLVPATTSLAQESALGAAADLAAQLRQTRQAAGAWESVGGEREIRAFEGEAVGGRIGVEDAAAIDREIRFVGEQAIAHICDVEQVPTIYQTRLAPTSLSVAVDGFREPPAESSIWQTDQVTGPGIGSLYRRWQMEGHSPSEGLQPTAAEHAGTGTGPRAIGLSPDVSYGELLMQRQLLALVGEGAGVPAAEIEDWLPRQRACQEAAGAACRAGRRHWCLRWLEARQQQRLDVWVAARRGAGYLVLFDELPMSAWVPAGGQMLAEAGDRLSVAIKRVSIRGDELQLADPRRVSPAADH